MLFLADRNALLDQAKRGDFKHFKEKMTIIRHKEIDKAYEIYLALYQGLTNYDEDKDAYREFTPTFFDLIVVDECHRGSAADDSAWRDILDYFGTATKIGLTAVWLAMLLGAKCLPLLSPEQRAVCWLMMTVIL